MITGSGHRLGERYVLEERIAVGGMGEVWRGRDEVLNRAVAVKILRLELAPDVAFQARFRAEARTAAGLSHGGIAAVYDYGEALRSAYLVMELVPGDPLSAMISREGALGTDRTLTIVAQAARALHAAHVHGVVHRDVKPANLMVTPELRVKITDFGISRPRDHEPLTATGQVMGTAHYLAPELARGEVATPLSDVYALGVVAYECLAGWRPFEGDNQVEVATAQLTQHPPPLPETVPPPVRQLVETAMAKNPAARPQGAKAFAAALEDLRLRRLAKTRPTVGGWSAQGEWSAEGTTPPSGMITSQRAGSAGGQYSRGGSSSRVAAGDTAADTVVERPPATRTAPAAPREAAPSGWAGAPAGLRDGVPEQGAKGDRPSRRSGPTTATMPDPASARGKGRAATSANAVRRLPMPMLALGGLIAIVSTGAILTNWGDDGTDSSEKTPRPAVTSTVSPGTSGPTDDDASRGQGPIHDDDFSDGTVDIDAGELVGRDVEEVRAWLNQTKVSYRLPRAASSERRGTVIDVSPTGPVRRGERVTVTVSRGSGG